MNQETYESMESIDYTDQLQIIIDQQADSNYKEQLQTIIDQQAEMLDRNIIDYTEHFQTLIDQQIQMLDRMQQFYEAGYQVVAMAFGLCLGAMLFGSLWRSMSRW